MNIDDKNGKHKSDPVAFMEAAIELAAEEEIETRQLNPADMRAAAASEAMIAPALAELRRRLVPAHTMFKRAAPAGPEFSTLDRATLLSRIESLRQRGVRYAFQDLNGLSDDDLRQMLSLLLETTEA